MSSSIQTPTPVEWEKLLQLINQAKVARNTGLYFKGINHNLVEDAEIEVEGGDGIRVEGGSHHVYRNIKVTARNGTGLSISPRHDEEIDPRTISDCADKISEQVSNKLLLDVKSELETFFKTLLDQSNLDKRMRDQILDIYDATRSKNKLHDFLSYQVNNLPGYAIQIIIGALSIILK